MAAYDSYGQGSGSGYGGYISPSARLPATGGNGAFGGGTGDPTPSVRLPATGGGPGGYDSYGTGSGSGGGRSGGNGGYGYGTGSGWNGFGGVDKGTPAAGSITGSGIDWGYGKSQEYYDQGKDQSLGQYVNPGMQATDWSNGAMANALGGNGGDASKQYWNGFMQNGPLNAAMDRAADKSSWQTNAMGYGHSGASEIARQRIGADMGYAATQDQTRNLQGQQALNQQYRNMGMNTTNQFADWQGTTAYNAGQQKDQLASNKYQIDEMSKIRRQESKSNNFLGGLGAFAKILGAFSGIPKA